MDENFDIKEEACFQFWSTDLWTETNCTAIYGHRHYHGVWTEEEKRKNKLIYFFHIRKTKTSKPNITIKNLLGPLKHSSHLDIKDNTTKW